MKRLISIAFCIFLSQMCNAQVMMMFSSDSLVNITSPLDLDSLFYWFAADVGVTDSLGGAIATDEGVGQWNDLSGNGYHVTQTTNGARPVYKATGGPGSKPCIQFDGSNDFLASAAHWWGSDDITIIVVMKFANATLNVAERVVAKNHTTANKRQWAVIGENTSQSYQLNLFLSKDGGTANFTNDLGGAKSTAYKVVAFTASVSSSTLFVDAASVPVARYPTGTGDGTIYDTDAALNIGCQNSQGTPALFLQGSISEIIVFSRALSATERAAIETYLNKKYDLYAAADSTRDELLKGPRTPSKILTAYETLRHIDAYKCALNDMNRDEIEQYLSRKYTLYYLIILGFPLASARRRKLIPNEKKNAA